MEKQGHSWGAFAQTLVLGLVVLITALFVLEVGGRAQEKKGNWVVAWTTSMIGLAQTPGGRGATPQPMTLTNATVRMIVRPTIGGNGVRVRIDNTFGTAPLAIGAGSVGVSLARRGLVEGSAVKLTFGGSPTATVPAGQRLMSDQAMLKVKAGQDI